MALLQLVDFHYYYGNIHSVKGIDLHVDEGEMVTLIGANGSGKTTTLQTISGLTRARGVRGKILFKGQEIQGKTGDKVAAMGILQALEGRHVFSKLTVEENLKTGAYLRKDMAKIREDIRDVYRRFPRLEERRSQLAGTLSGGEQQMLAIGRALMGRPKLLLLDEPSMGLAPLIVKEIFVAINDINREGTTILFVEQNSKIALATAKRGYVMQTGSIVIHDTCENLMNNEDIKRIYLGAS
ncbi:MAG: ABC transporter ATP-binding protein [Clostridiales bacterium]|jgi:branched-chain amino acid transport system ATP-binding protein|nr:ABC transporter ATP-binding protein [Clostridiales bacterium]OPZ67376.1 MAG: High-affinity branched-chain amino acid transport ATP-binding protein LivF [Firmicutes bacterium ADurb.Bin467]